MLTKPQTILIHTAVRALRMPDASYRQILANIAHVSSSTQLDNAGFEDVMAVLEDQGWRMPGRPADHFRNKVKLRGTFCGERAVFKVRELIAGSRYRLEGLVRRFSHNRTDQVSKLSPAQAHQLIEMLKASAGRPERSRAGPPPPDQPPPLFPDAEPRPLRPPAAAPARPARVKDPTPAPAAHGSDFDGPDDVPF